MVARQDGEFADHPWQAAFDRHLEADVQQAHMVESLKFWLVVVKFVVKYGMHAEGSVHLDQAELLSMNRPSLVHLLEQKHTGVKVQDVFLP